MQWVDEGRLPTTYKLLWIQLLSNVKNNWCGGIMNRSMYFLNFTTSISLCGKYCLQSVPQIRRKKNTIGSKIFISCEYEGWPSIGCSIFHHSSQLVLTHTLLKKVCFPLQGYHLHPIKWVTCMVHFVVAQSKQ